jgi:small subunit ribosomal protein S21
LLVQVRDNNVEQALKALKKKMQREGIFREMKLRNYYEKPSEKRVREQAEAVRRARKLARKKAQREGLLPGKAPAARPGAPGRPAVRRVAAAASVALRVPAVSAAVAASAAPARQAHRTASIDALSLDPGGGAFASGQAPRSRPDSQHASCAGRDTTLTIPPRFSPPSKGTGWLASCLAPRVEPWHAAGSAPPRTGHQPPPSLSIHARTVSMALLPLT